MKGLTWRRSALVLLGILAVVAMTGAWLSNGTHKAHADATNSGDPVGFDAKFITNSTTPPTEAQCFAVGRRCFSPQATQAAYNVGPLYAAGFDGRGTTIAVVDSYGSDTIAHDLHVFNQAFGLQSMCGEEGVTCAAGMPTFSQLALQGNPATKAPPGQSNGTGLENKSAWALEVSL
ncbi:MAG TPA: hypothetical protein VE258_00060, partial [Ktedonobacterales bacterium]|nr:hypothetical protein [Ktedonobacterales bacterium]